MKRAIFLSFVLISTFAIYPDVRFTVNTSHAKAVNSIDVDSETGFVFSVADDGKLIIHDIKKQFVFDQRQISSLQIKKVIKHPTNDIIAVYETDNLHKYQISVWDINKWEKLYTHSLAEAPLYMGFSPKGTYILYTTTNWNSITFLETKTGDISPIISDGFGIVPSLFVSSSEKTIITYSPSGKIFYIDMKTGMQKSAAPISTINDLTQVAFHNKGRFLVGIRDNEIYLIDMFTGSIVDRLNLGNIQSFALANDSIYAYVKRGNYYYLKKVIISNNVLLENIANDRNIPLAHSISATENYLFVPGIDGRLYVYDTATLHPIEYTAHLPVPLSDTQFYKNSLYCLYDNEIIVIDNEFNSIQSLIPEISIEGFYIHQDTLVFWDKDLAVYRYDLILNTTDVFLSLTEPVKAISAFGDKIAILENNGILHVVSISGNAISRKYPTKGLNTIVMPNDSTILGGRNIGGSFNTSLVQINSNTGEIIGVDNKNSMIVDMALNPVTSVIYTLGVQERRGIQYTIISEITNSTYTDSTPIAAFKGIDNTIAYCADPFSSKFFTSTGSEGVQMYSWDGFTVLEKSPHITTHLSISPVYLISLNNDFTLSFWEKKSGTFLFDLYLFDDTTFLMTFKDGTYYSNKNESDIIHYFDSRNRLIADIDKYQRHTPF